MAEFKFDVFVSHAQADSADAHRLASELRKAGKSVFLDDQDLVPGDDWERSITNSLEHSSNVVMLISCNSLTSQSSSYEIGLALDHARRTPGVNIVPVLLEGVNAATLPAPLRSVESIDLSKTWEGVTEAITRALAPTTKGEV